MADSVDKRYLGRAIEPAEPVSNQCTPSIWRPFYTLLLPSDERVLTVYGTR